MHSSNIYCKFGLPFMGINSFGVHACQRKQSSPKPANGIMACFLSYDSYNSYYHCFIEMKILQR